MNSTSLFNKILQIVPDPHVFTGLSDGEVYRCIDYLYSIIKDPTPKLFVKNRIISLFVPFSKRSVYPFGLRWSINVYKGCTHRCKYCFMVKYNRNHFEPQILLDYKSQLQKDISDLSRLNIPARPIHISDSSDPLQDIENINHLTLFTLEQLLLKQDLFSSVIMLTKNPAILTRAPYLQTIKNISNLQVGVSVTFFNNEKQRFWEPGAPDIPSRLSAIKFLCENNVNVVLRIDPIFLRDPLPKKYFTSSSLADYGAIPAHSLDEILSIIDFAFQNGISRIIMSPLRLVQSRFQNNEAFSIYRNAYEHTIANASGKSKLKMPWLLFQEMIKEPVEYAKNRGIKVVFLEDNSVKKS